MLIILGNGDSMMAAERSRLVQAVIANGGRHNNYSLVTLVALQEIG